ncbi:histidine kinase [Sphingobacterium haloxyli]|uniref:Signal transduction histidine kinase internal region domain-containing protein n=1 Tax=Sphingobacterium haloxyli TaxID=2100533 RepID=A0A2S9IWV5_9SPHI|nr:histidine kinase [Sphingobacterium haloxyli]PRD45002.1 hypothetical protein C5745_18720 [Sphingobacterium haloxyli]
MSERKEDSFLPLFLFDPRCRIQRHLLLILVGAIITFNQVFVAYQDSQYILGNRIYLICFSSYVLYLMGMYFNYFYLTPKLLLKNKYIAYIIILSMTVLSLPTLSIFIEYWVRQHLGLPHRISSYTSPLILVDNLATSMVAIICFCGISVVLLFRHWTGGISYINRLEEEHIRSELDKLKGQIAPAFLSRVLKDASAAIGIDSKKSTDMLMQMGQLLRYQLYDCDREKILLQSELNFLAKYLELERLSRPDIRFHLRTEGDINRVFISPMLCITLTQYAMEDSKFLDLHIYVENNILFFRCKSDGTKKYSNDSFPLIKRNLELKYPEKHNLVRSKGHIELTIDFSE